MKFLLRSCIILLFIFLSIPDIYADGCFVWKRGVDLEEPSQKAVIYHHDGVETLILQVKYAGAAEDFAWIVPLPNQPEVTVLEPEKSPFEELSKYTQHRDRKATLALSLSEGRTKEVEVLDRKVVGVYDIAVIRSDDSGAITDWLIKNGYMLPEKARSIFNQYVKKNWVFAAMRIDAKSLSADTSEKLITGSLQPILFKLQTKEAVYPLKISSMNAGETDLLLYIIADVPLRVRDNLGKPGLGMANNIRDPRFHNIDYDQTGRCSPDHDHTVYYGTKTKTSCFTIPLTCEAIGIDKKKTFLHLCKFRAMFSSSEMTDDLTFIPFDPVDYFARKYERTSSLLEKMEIATYLMKCHEIDYSEPLGKILAEMSKSEDPILRRKAANHSSTSAECLKLIAENCKKNETRRYSSDDKNMLRNLAEHPNASAEVLRLVFQKIKPTNSMVRHPETPPDVLVEIAKLSSGYNAKELIEHPNLTNDYFLLLVIDGVENIRRLVAEDDRCPPETRLELLENPRGSRQNRKLELPMETIIKLSGHPDSYVRTQIAGIRKLPVNLLVKMAKDQEPKVRRKVIWNINITEEILEDMAGDEDALVKADVAGRYMGSGSVFKKLARDVEVGVRRAVASNPNTSKEILERLAKDDSFHVRNGVAYNENAPPEALRLLAEEEDSRILYGVAHNANTPISILERLANLRNKKSKINECIIKGKDPSSSVRAEVAGDSHLPKELIVMLAQDNSIIVRVKVAGNSSTPSDILSLLAEDKNIDVRRRVAHNKNAPLKVLKLLADDESQEIRRNVACNAGASEQILKRLAEDESVKVRRMVAQNKKTPAEALKLLAGDEDYNVRYSVARHKNTPLAVLEKLTEDQHPKVKKTALLHIERR